MHKKSQLSNLSHWLPLRHCWRQESQIPKEISREIHQLRMLEGLQLLRESGFDRAVAWCLNLSQGARLSWRSPQLPFTSLSFSNTSFQWVLGWNYSGPSNWSVLEDVLFQRILVFFMVPVSRYLTGTPLSPTYPVARLLDEGAFMVLSILLCFILRGYSSAYQQLFIPILKYLFCVFVHLFCFSYLFWCTVA